MKQFLITVVGTIIGIFTFFLLLFLFFMVLGVASGVAASSKTKSDIVLTMDLRKPVQDHSAGTGLFVEPPQSIVGITRSLNAAKNDDRVKGVFIRASAFGMTPASAEDACALLSTRTSRQKR